MDQATYTSHIFSIAFDPVTFAAWTKDRRGGGSRLAVMRERMLMAQSGLCVYCGQGDFNMDKTNKTDMSPEWAHLVPNGYFDDMSGMTGGERIGWVDGNMTVQHKKCNSSHGEREVRFEDLARPDLVWVGPWRDLPMLPK
jgi:hypothetical protein